LDSKALRSEFEQLKNGCLEKERKNSRFFEISKHTEKVFIEAA